jgi:hypothetical protein
MVTDAELARMSPAKTVVRRLGVPMWRAPARLAVTQVGLVREGCGGGSHGRVEVAPASCHRAAADDELSACDDSVTGARGCRCRGSPPSRSR